MHLLRLQEDALDSAGVASNISLASAVFAVNTAAPGSDHLVTLVDENNTNIGSFTMIGRTSEIIHKKGTDKLFAANPAVKFTKIAR